MAATGGDSAAAYIPVIVETDDGEAFQFEVSLADTVRSFKAVVQMELEVAEENQQIFLGGTALTDDTARLGEYGIQEGSKIRLVVKEEEGSEEPVDAEMIDAETGEPLKQFVVKCNLAAGKTKEVVIPVKASETFLTVKEKVYDKFVEMSDVLGRLPPKAYGLFKVKADSIDKAGPTEWIKREALLKDEWVLGEFTLGEDEEVHMMHLFYMSG